MDSGGLPQEKDQKNEEVELQLDRQSPIDSGDVAWDCFEKTDGEIVHFC
jgi:hypothetical protein